MHAEILGHRMAWVEAGEGDPIVFLHGNASSSYVWRNVIPHVAGAGLCLAPDLIGMGDSAKLPPGDRRRYAFDRHRRFLDALLAHLSVTDRVTLVGHDWGSALVFDWANRHRDAVKGICYMEALVRPLTWEEWPPPERSMLRNLRGAPGDDLVLRQNVVVKQMLPRWVLRDLSFGERREYRRPFRRQGEDRLPTLAWMQELPIGGAPADVVSIVDSYAAWLARSTVPKLFVNGEPGWMLTGAQREYCRMWPNQTEVAVQGTHLLQEDSPDEIGRALSTWYASL